MDHLKGPVDHLKGDSGVFEVGGGVGWGVGIVGSCSLRWFEVLSGVVLEPYLERMDELKK